MSPKLKHVKTNWYNTTDDFGIITKGERLKFPLSKVEYYDNMERLLKTQYYDINKELKEKETWEYNEDGNMIEHGKIMADDVICFYRKYVFDNNGYKKESFNYSNEKWCKWQVYVNDEQGNIIEEKDVNPNTYKYEYEYNEKGNWIELNVFNAQGDCHRKMTRTYFEKENKTIEKILDFENDKWIFGGTYSWVEDRYGNIIEDIGYSECGTIEYMKIFRYVFDEFNNWTLCIESENGKLNRIAEREIKYYEIK